MDTFLIISALFLTFTMLMCLIRAVIGDSVFDRIIAINVIGTKVVVLIAFVSYIFEESFILDIAIVYAMVSFLTTVVLTRLFTKEDTA